MVSKKLQIVGGFNIPQVNRNQTYETQNDHIKRNRCCSTETVLLLDIYKTCGAFLMFVNTTFKKFKLDD